MDIFGVISNFDYFSGYLIKSTTVICLSGYIFTLIHSQVLSNMIGVLKIADMFWVDLSDQVFLFFFIFIYFFFFFFFWGGGGACIERMLGLSLCSRKKSPRNWLLNSKQMDYNNYLQCVSLNHIFIGRLADAISIDNDNIRFCLEPTLINAIMLL